MAKINFAPGIVSESTPFQVSSGWVDGNLGRFRNGNFSPIGGWAQFAAGSAQGVCRSMHEWSNLAGINMLAMGTHLKCHVLVANAIYDITPLRPAKNLQPDPFTTLADSSKLQLIVPYHQAVSGDFVHVSGATTGVGNYSASDLNRVWRVDSVGPDLDRLVLVGIKDAGAAGQSGGGSSVVAQPETQTGLIDASIATGFGVGPYNVGKFNTPRVPSSNTLADIILQPRIWHMDNFGEWLLMCPRGGANGGPIYLWRPTGGFGQRATLLSSDPFASDVPEFAAGIFVNPQAQSVVALGCCPLGKRTPDPMQVRWSDFTNPFDWTPTAANNAGGYRLPAGSLIIGWLPTYYETIIWTDTTVYSMQLAGNSFGFAFQPIARGVSIISPRAAVSNGSIVAWMDRGSFYVYSGSAAELPCPLKKEVFDSINLAQAWKVFSAHNHSFSEISWFYPVGDEVDHYVTWNYRENVWTKGLMDRTAWSDSGRLSTPVGIDPSGRVFFHERGTDANGSPLPYFIQSGDIMIEDGNIFVKLQRFIADFQFEKGLGANQKTWLDIMVRDSPSQPRVTVETIEVTPNNVNNGFFDFNKVRGRYVSFRIYNDGPMAVTGTSFIMGASQAQYIANGKR